MQTKSFTKTHQYRITWLILQTIWVDDTYILPNSAYALLWNLDGTGADILDKSVYTIWKLSRNISLILITLFVAIGSIATMYQMQIGPRLVASIYTLIPQAVFATLITIFSYPIITMAFNIGMGGMSIGRDLAFGILGQLLTQGTTDVYPTVSTGIEAIVQEYVLLGWHAIIILVAVIVAIVGIILGALSWTWQFFIVHLNFIKYTMYIPLVSSFSVLPGKSQRTN